MNTLSLTSVVGIDPVVLFEKILTAIDNGATTTEIRANPHKYIVSGKMKEIVINEGGSELPLSRKILKEMAIRGDELAASILNKPFLFYPPKVPTEDTDDNMWASFHIKIRGDRYPERFNPILIEMLKEGCQNNGWDLVVYRVYEEEWSYEVRNRDDGSDNEYLIGGISYYHPETKEWVEC